MLDQASLGFATLRWRDGGLELLDQTALPAEERYLRPAGLPELVAAIRRLAVRGAPALGCAGAYGMVLAVAGEDDPVRWRRRLETGAEELIAARPTAVNLAVGVGRLLAAGRRLAGDGADPRRWTQALLAEARAFHAEDEALCAEIGRNGAELLPDPVRILTHCNAGALATGGIGTALGVVYAARAAGRTVRVLADETRPLLQGARLTAWELTRAGIPVTVQADGAAGSALAAGEVDAVIVGADRIAANGDVANKVGTYPLAVLAREHGVPFYVAAPTTTIDLDCPDGSAIPIEQRPEEEVLAFAGAAAAPGARARNPAFDLTPAALVTALVTERGVLPAPDRTGLAAHCAGASSG
ncbi:MAG: S-methyl-5-thioribose-1-phosphate isomerase [Planctomycetota bacterium]|nr:MAG: S-methyl-5-thioribose-1-phosphate isomerase [Planctomycetota bacterium]